MDSLMSLVSGVYNLFVSTPSQPLQSDLATQVPASSQGIQNNAENQALISAVLNRDIEGVKTALVKGAQIDSIHENRQTALMIAASIGHRVITSILLAQGANHALEDEDGFTALELAIYFGKTEVAQILLNKGVFFDSDTLNHLLKYNKAIHVILKLSLQKFCVLDLNLALKTAFDSKDAHLITLLRREGAIPLMKLHEDELREAALKGNLEKVQALLALGFPVDKQCQHFGNTALIFALKKGHLNIAKLLIDHGADVTLGNNFGETPFSLCAVKSHHSMKFLHVCHNMLDNMSLEQIKALEQNPGCAVMITPYMKKTMSNLQEILLCFFSDSFYIPIELKQHIVGMMPCPKWFMPAMLENIIAERVKKTPAVIFSSVYQPDAMEIDVEEKAEPKKKDRSVLL